MAQYVVFYSAAAEKALQRLPRTAQVRISAAVDALKVDPRPLGAIKMEGEITLWRIRVGDYRVVYEIEDKALRVLVIRVAHRKDVYRNM